jgi:hypothetical protein
MVQTTFEIAFIRQAQGKLLISSDRYLAKTAGVEMPERQRVLDNLEDCLTFSFQIGDWERDKSSLLIHRRRAGDEVDKSWFRQFLLIQSEI